MKSRLIAIRYIVPTLLALQAAGAQVREPTVARTSIWIDTVKRGQMLREVHGNGTLVPQVTRWVPAPADGRVEKILIQAGVEVGAGTV